MKLIALAAVVFAVAAPCAHAQSTACTPTAQPASLTALADGQAAGSITPRAIRNVICAQATSVTNVSTATYSASASDQLLCVSPSAATTVTLAASPVVGEIQTVVDCGGSAGTNNITVQPASGTIMGYTNVLMNQNNEALAFQYTGSTWVLR